MLPTTRGAGPTDLHSLIGAPIGTTMPGIPGMPGGFGVETMPGVVPGMPGVSPTGELPNYLLNQVSGNLSSELKGELPADVQNMLAQQAAEYGVASGTQGSQFQGYRGLRNLGLTSLDLQKHAEDLLAGQFTKPSDQQALNQSATKIRDLEDQFNKEFGLKKEELAQQLALEKQKFAAAQAQQAHQNELGDLEALGLKYGGEYSLGRPVTRGPDVFSPVPFGGF